VTHDVVAARFLVPAALLTFLLMASRAWLAYSGRTAGSRLRQVIVLEPPDQADPRGELRTELFFAALAILLLIALVVDNLGRPDGTIALLLGAGGLRSAAIWIAVMPKMTSPEQPTDGEHE
jgi:hypothetical protein